MRLKGRDPLRHLAPRGHIGAALISLRLQLALCSSQARLEVSPGGGDYSADYNEETQGGVDYSAGKETR